MMTLLIFVTWVCIALVVYVYAGYPALLALLSRVMKRPVQKGDTALPISLIIAAYNEEAVIAQKIENSLALSYPPEKREIIVAADGSNDATAQIAMRYADRGVKVLHTPERRGKSAALNRAVAIASGEILVFSDANAYYDADALRHLSANFNDPQVGQVSGKKTVRQSKASVGASEGLYWRYESFIKKQESKIHSTVGVVGEINALRKSLFTPIPDNIINDDAYLAFRVMKNGARIIYEPDAFSWETASETAKDEVVRRRRINAGRYQLFFQPHLWPWNNLLVLFMLFSHKFLRLLLPFFMVGAFIGNIAVVLLQPSQVLMSLTLLGQIAFYALAVLGLWADRQGIKNKAMKLATFAYFIVNSNYAAYEGFIRHMRGSQTVLWEKVTRSAD